MCPFERGEESKIRRSGQGHEEELQKGWWWVEQFLVDTRLILVLVVLVVVGYHLCEWGEGDGSPLPGCLIGGCPFPP